MNDIDASPNVGSAIALKRDEVLRSLLERVGAATGWDRELDAAIEGAFHEELPPVAIIGVEQPLRLFRSPGGPGSAHRYTASLDAVLFLVGERMPSEWGSILREGLQSLATKHDWHMCVCLADQIAELPRAALAAFLRREIEGNPMTPTLPLRAQRKASDVSEACQPIKMNAPEQD